MNKLATFILFVFLAIIFASLYGIINDQITYSISEEFYTKEKFIQYAAYKYDFLGIKAHSSSSELYMELPRLGVALVATLASWWMGFIAGIFLGLIGLLQKNSEAMLKVSMKALFLTLFITCLGGNLGLFYAKYFMTSIQETWYYPVYVFDVPNFLIVKSIHAFTYGAGFLGILIGMGFSFFKFYRAKKQKTSL